MRILERRIKLQFNDNSFTEWMTDEEMRHCEGDNIKAVFIQETMSYKDAMQYIGIVR